MEGKSAEEIETAAYNKQPPARDVLITEGTTPRRIEILLPAWPIWSAARLIWNSCCYCQVFSDYQRALLQAQNL